MKLHGKRALVLCPHGDDEIHCAGTTVAMIEGGAVVHVVAFSACEESIPDDFPRDILRAEFMDSMSIMGVKEDKCEIRSERVRHFSENRQDILEQMVALCSDIQPSIVLCPSSTDSHQDHRVIHQEAVRAFRNCPLLLGYESGHNQRASVTTCYIELDPRALAVKLSAWSAYRSQGFRRYFDRKYINALALVRGRQARVRSGLAEAFEVISMTVRV